MKMDLFNQKGLTLLELLAAISILSIVLLVYMSFFTNAFSYNSKSSNKLQSVNIVQDVESCLKNNNNLISNLKSGGKIISTSNKCKNISSVVVNSRIIPYNFSFHYHNYYVQVSIANDNKLRNLYPTTIEILNNEERVTESYLYLKEEES